MNKDEKQKELRAVAYIRVASKSQADAEASQRQREAVNKWAARPGITVVGQFDDSGKKPGARRPFSDLLAHSKELGASYIVCQDYSRLSRNAHDSAKFHEEAKRNGIQIVTTHSEGCP